jgi:preprotein translocase subunit SecY
MSLFGFGAESGGFAGFWFKYLGTGTVLYGVLTCALILFFAYIYAQIQFNPADVSLNIQQHGGFIPGIRPGKPTAEYLKKISNRITLFGATFLAFIALVPSIVFGAIGGSGLTSAFSATGLLIVVSVAIEFDKQLEALMLMRNYKGFLNTDAES